MIKDHTLDRAIVEALRFVKLARALRAKRKAKARSCWGPRPDIALRVVTRVEHAATERASMDLTRTLADLRQGR